MSSIWIVLGGSVALALGGCSATTSTYMKVGEGFSETMDGAKASVKLLADQRTRVARVSYANNVIVLNHALGNSVEKEFGDFVCKGTGALAEARAGLGVLGKYSERPAPETRPRRGEFVGIDGDHRRAASEAQEPQAIVGAV